jgi:hypothetical protein
MRNASIKDCRENKKYTFLFRYFSPTTVPAVYNIMSKNVVEPEKPQMTIRRRAAC